MFDTMTLTKIVGSLCGALLIFLMGNWAADALYTTGGGHGDDHAQGYVIEVAANDAADEEAEAGPSLFDLMASADVDKGAKVFGKCKACHKLEDGANGVGPYLHGVVGRDVETAAGYGYSGSLAAAAQVWTPETLDAFLENPKGYAPGTSMGFAGLKKPADRANVIAYLDQTDGDTYQMDAPAASEAAAEEPATEEPVEEAAAQEPEPAAEEAAAEPAATETADAGDGASGFAALVASADAKSGKKVFRQCRACHSLKEGKNSVGPSLFGLLGRDVASAEGFNYSDALAAFDGNWTVDQLNAWLESPSGLVPGNKMPFAGVKSEEDRAALIAFLKESDS